MSVDAVPHREIVPTLEKVVVALTAASLLGGCSLTFLKKAPKNAQEGTWVDCSESKLMPIGDVVFGSSFAISALGISQVDDENPELRNVGAVMYGLGGMALLYSAYVGFKATSRCERLPDAAEARGIYGPYPAYPPPYPYPYPYPPPQPYPPQPYPYPQPQPQPQPQGPQ